MKTNVVEKCQSLFTLAQKDGECTTSTEKEESDGDAVGYGSRNERTHHTLKSGPFVIKTTEDKWKNWNPVSDQEGITYYLEILRGSKNIFSAVRNGTKKEDRFTSGDERFAGRNETEAGNWTVSSGRMPVKFLKEGGGR